MTVCSRISWSEQLISNASAMCIVATINTIYYRHFCAIQKKIIRLTVLRTMIRRAQGSLIDLVKSRLVVTQEENCVQLA